MRYVIKEAVVPIITLMLPALTIAQGQDSSTWVRDQQVIATMLTGVYSNANQAYFDKRGKIKNPHARRGHEAEMPFGQFLGSRFLSYLP